MRIRLPLALLVFASFVVSAARAQDDLLDIAKPKGKPASSGLDDLLDGGDRGTVFRLVTAAAPHKPLSEMVYWRSVQNVVAAQTTPIEFRLGDVELIAPQTITAAGEATVEPTYPTAGQVKTTPGKHVITPGNLPVEITARGITSKHPAIKVVEGKTGPEVLILCAPVRFDGVDPQGVPQPVTVQIARGNKSLLRQNVRFNPLVLWLPVGADYTSSLGSFTLAADGKIQAQKSQLTAGVTATESGLRKLVDDVARSVAVSDVLQFNSGALAPPFSVYVPPVIKPGEPAWLAVRREQYEQATSQPLGASTFAVEVDLGASGLGMELCKVQPGTPDAQLVGRGASALAASSAGLAWYRIELPQTFYGPVSLAIREGSGRRQRTSVLSLELGQTLQLVPHRWRTAFAETESGVYHVLVSGPFAGGQVQVMCQLEGGSPRELATLDVPAVKAGEHDARSLVVAMKSLPAGSHRLWVDSSAGRSPTLPLTVVNWMHHSPFFTHSMSGCTACWPTTNEGLALMRQAGIDMGSATGARSLLDTDMPAIDVSLAGRVKKHLTSAPAELATMPTGNDLLLDRLTRHEIRLIDLAVVRAAGMYNEGLSYHHSYQPSVDRMVRRMQLFTQQTGDYASFWGVNYSWFPALGGYVEGGVPTDPHTGDRNQALGEMVRAAGFEPPTREERQWLRKKIDLANPAEVAQAASVARRAIDSFRASQDLGWGKHNQLYNAAIHEVRPGTVCTLFENAGHDEGKRTRALFGDMNASCYESYTDYGDWPMSSAFAVDWAHGNHPAKPVWLTTCWGSSQEGAAKSLFHAFARGMEGGGVPMQGTNALSVLAQRAKAMKFVSQYGAIAAHATPERRVAILSRIAKQVLTPRGMYQQHALYYHLTRLGFPPILVADEDILAKGEIPGHVQVLALAEEEWPLEPETLAVIQKFQARGGKVLLAGQSHQAVKDAIVVDVPLKHLWQMSGFMPQGHKDFWQEFHERWQGPLAAAMAQTGISPLATTDADQALALTMDDGEVRYVVVIADAADTHSNEFTRPAQLPVSLAGQGWIVRDLAKQTTLPTTQEGGATKTSVDLITEPTTILAAYQSAPAGVKVEVQAGAKLGQPLVFRTAVVAQDASLQLGGVPIALTLTAPNEQVRREWFDAAGRELTVPLAEFDQAGTWTLTVQELLTGVTTVAKFPVVAGHAQPIEPIGDVHVVDAGHLHQFVHRAGEKLIIVEPGQQSLVPLAEKLATDLKAVGVGARVWQVQPEEFDTIPVRWYPRPDDMARLDLIKAGKLIGYREGMKAYIDKIKRVHVSEMGGYEEIDPPYMVGQDCIVFSGGRLCESLRAVTPWINTPTVPGRGQGRLVVCFSPFMANRQAAAVLANDADGMAKVAAQLVAAYRQPQQVDSPTPSAAPLLAVKSTSETRPVAQPYRNYSPEDRVRGLLASRTGKAAVLLTGEKDDAAFVDENGKVTGSVRLPDTWLKTHYTIDDSGALVGLDRVVLAKHPGWGFATELSYDLTAISPSGERAWQWPAYSGSAGLAPDHQAGFRLANDGKTAVLTRASALLMGQRGEPGWRRYDELPHVARRFEVLYPRTSVGTTFSADNRYVLVTFDSRPPFGNMGQGLASPSSAETVLIDLTSGQRVWALRDADYRKATYAVHSGFAAVSEGAERTALCSFDGVAIVVDKTGKIVAEQQAAPRDPAPGRLGPVDGVGVWMSDKGELAAFGFKQSLLFYAGGKLTSVPVAGVQSGCISPDGSLLVVALEGGEVQALSPAGELRWKATAVSGKALVASAGSRGFLMAGSDGQVALIDAAGKDVWRCDVVKATDVAAHPLKDAASFVRVAEPADYAEPQTLATIKQKLGGQQVAAWKPQGTATERFGRKFYEVAGSVELSTGSEPSDQLLHLVYRRPEGNTSLQATVTDRDGTRTFVLDLPTPEFRVVDLPLRGPGVKVTISGEGAFEVAEASMWSFRLPGENLAYVKPAGSDFDAGGGKPKENKSDDILADLGEKPSGNAGLMKDCKIYYPNSDIDRVKGPYLPAAIDPTLMVDAKRYDAKLVPWAAPAGMYKPTRGAFFTIDFGKTTPLGMIATYDRSLKQSEVCQSVVAFTGEELDEATSGKVLRGVSHNDQFWRLFPLEKSPVRVLGIHVFSGAQSAIGLSEVEAYK